MAKPFYFLAHQLVVRPLVYVFFGGSSAVLSSSYTYTEDLILSAWIKINDNQDCDLNSVAPCRWSTLKAAHYKRSVLSYESFVVQRKEVVKFHPFYLNGSLVIAVLLSKKILKVGPARMPHEPAGGSIYDARPLDMVPLGRDSSSFLFDSPNFKITF